MDKQKISYNIELLSERNAVKSIEPILLEIKDILKISEQKFYNILIAATEAVNNAIIHGNACNPNKKVHFEINVSNSKILMIIKDEGGGFNPNNLDDPREPENLLKANGRGVFLIKQLAQNVKFSHCSSGTIVEIMFEV